MTLDMILGLGIVAFLLIYFAFQWNTEEHFIFQLMTSFFVLSIILLIPTIALQEKDTCSIEVLNQTVTGNITVFNYDNVCITNSHTTFLTFYKIITWFYRLFIAYIFVYFNWALWFKKRIFMNSTKGRQR